MRRPRSLTNVMNKKPSEPMFAQADRHETLQDIEIRIAVAFNKDRSVLENGDIPAYHDPIHEVSVRGDGVRLDLLPTGIFLPSIGAPVLG